MEQPYQGLEVTAAQAESFCESIGDPNGQVLHSYATMSKVPAGRRSYCALLPGAYTEAIALSEALYRVSPACAPEDLRLLSIDMNFANPVPIKQQPGLESTVAKTPELDFASSAHAQDGTFTAVPSATYQKGGEAVHALANSSVRLARARLASEPYDTTEEHPLTVIRGGDWGRYQEAVQSVTGHDIEARAHIPLFLANNAARVFGAHLQDPSSAEGYEGVFAQLQQSCGFREMTIEQDTATGARAQHIIFPESYIPGFSRHSLRFHTPPKELLTPPKNVHVFLNDVRFIEAQDDRPKHYEVAYQMAIPGPDAQLWKVADIYWEIVPFPTKLLRRI